jgi:hypothetical protein
MTIWYFGDKRATVIRISLWMIFLNMQPNVFIGIMHRRVACCIGKTYGTRYGMAIMTHRATFALDARAITRLKKLAMLWGASQAEVIRRSLEIAEQTHSRGQDAQHRLEAAGQLRKRLETQRISVDDWISAACESRR